MDKKTNNDLQNTTQKTKYRAMRNPLKPWVNSDMCHSPKHVTRYHPRTTRFSVLWYVHELYIAWFSLILGKYMHQVLFVTEIFVLKCPVQITEEIVSHLNKKLYYMLWRVWRYRRGNQNP